MQSVPKYAIFPEVLSQEVCVSLLGKSCSKKCLSFAEMGSAAEHGDLWEILSPWVHKMSVYKCKHSTGQDVASGFWMPVSPLFRKIYLPAEFNRGNRYLVMMVRFFFFSWDSPEVAFLNLWRKRLLLLATVYEDRLQRLLTILRYRNLELEKLGNVALNGWDFILWDGQKILIICLNKRKLGGIYSSLKRYLGKQRV